jgi:uncharacterized protein with HEPN domain
MSKKAPELLLLDMLDSIESIKSFTKGMSYDQFVEDKKTRDAVLRNLEVLGEAANRLNLSIRNDHPEVEWNKIIRSRNVIIHDYDIVDYSIIWKICTVHLGPLKSLLEKILKTIE